MMLWCIALVVAAVALWYWYEKPPRREKGSVFSRFGRNGDGWALVTGASAGMGMEFARELAAEGMNLVLTARRKERLEQLAEELQNAYGIRTHVIAEDLSQPDGPLLVWKEIQRSGFPVSLVVLNAGFGFQGRMSEQDPFRLRDLIQVNCTAIVLLVNRWLGWVKHKALQEDGITDLAGNKFGLLVVSSLAGYLPVPLNATYSASKAFVSNFGLSISREVESDPGFCHAVDVFLFEPGTVETDFQTASGQVSHPGMSARDAVCAALNGLMARRTIRHVPIFKQWIITAVATFLPKTWMSWVALGISRKHLPAQQPDYVEYAL